MGKLLGENGKKILLLGGFALGLYLALKFIFPLTAPFILAFLVVYLCHPWLERTQKRTHIRKEILLGGLLLLLALMLFGGIWALISWGTVHAADIGEGMTRAQEQVDSALHDGCVFLEQKFGMDAAETEEAILERMDSFSENMKTDVLPEAAKQSWVYLKELAGAAAFLGISFISSMLLCKDYESIMEKAGENAVMDACRQFVERTAALVGGYLKAQAVILLVISAVAVAGLLIGRVKGAVFLGFLAGFLDALPFIGTGIVLLPAALWQLLCGKVSGAVTAVVVYVLCIAVRELLEPRLLGKQTGMYPVVMLLAVYAGIRMFGLSGLFLGPLYAVLLKEGASNLCGCSQMDRAEKRGDGQGDRKQAKKESQGK